MMQCLSVDVVKCRKRMVEAIDFQNERIPLTPRPSAFVLCIEESGEGISHLSNEFFGTVRLRQTVQMCGQDSVGQQSGICFKNSSRHVVEATGQVGLASEQEFVFGRRQGDVVSLPHRISFSSLHNPFAHFLPLRFFRHSRNAEHEGTKLSNRNNFYFFSPETVIQISAIRRHMAADHRCS